MLPAPALADLDLDLGARAGRDHGAGDEARARGPAAPAGVPPVPVGGALRLAIDVK